MKFIALTISYLSNNCKKYVKNLLKKFANQKNCRTFVSGLRKRGSLSGINLLVISFSVINYVVSKSVRLRQADTLFLCMIPPLLLEAMPAGLGNDMGRIIAQFTAKLTDIGLDFTGTDHGVLGPDQVT